jgi:hypothetical protein
MEVVSLRPGPRGPAISFLSFSLHDIADACDDFDGNLVGKAGKEKIAG